MRGCAALAALASLGLLAAAGPVTTDPHERRSQFDQHVVAWRRSLWLIRQRKENEAAMAAKRERDAPIIRAAELKRQRKRAKAKKESAIAADRLTEESA